MWQRPGEIRVTVHDPWPQVAQSLVKKTGKPTKIGCDVFTPPNILTS